MILFICKQRSCSNYSEGKFGLWNSASFVVDALNKEGIESKLVTVVDGNGVDRAIVENKANIVICEAIWITPSKLRELVRLHPNVEFCVRIHSKIPFLANEGMALQWCNEYQSIEGITIAGNNLHFVNDMKKAGYRIDYLPNIYKYQSHNYPPKIKDVITIGCFGSIRPMKNHLIQAISAINFANNRKLRLNFAINSSRNEQNGDSVLKNIRALFENNPNHELIEFPWLSHEEFLGIVKFMNIGMQVSYTESFNIVSADLIRLNIPVVTSSEVEFNTSWLHADPNSSYDIEMKLNRAYNYGPWLNVLSNINLDRSNVEALQAWHHWISS